MRRGVLAVVLVAFAGWFVWKALPFLRAERAAVWSTPTVRPEGPAPLVPVTVRRDQRACIDGVDFGPDARFVEVVLQSVGGRPTPPVRVEATGPGGYRATARIAQGAPSEAPVDVPIRPAEREIGGGTLCFAPEGRNAARFFGTGLGRNASASRTTIDGRPIDGQLSVTLLTSPHQSLGSRLGDVSAHIARFRPVTGWQVFLLGLLAVVGVPVAVGVALARAAAADDRPQDDSARR